MRGRLVRRRRWLAAAVLSLSAAGGTVAQVASVPPLVITPPVKPVPAPPPPVVPIVVPEPPKLELPTIAPPPAVKQEAPPPRPVATAPDIVKPAVPATTASIVRSAKVPMAEIIAAGPKPVDDIAAFKTALADAKAAYVKVRDYSGHLIVQQRLKGQLQDEQTAEFRERINPRGVAVKLLSPSSQVGRELVFLEGRHGNKVRVKAAGTYGPLAFASFAVSDVKAAVTARHSLADIGLGGILDRLDRALATEAKLKNTVAVAAADFTFAGKTVTRFDVRFDRPHALRDAARCVVCIDPDTKLPVRLEVYDAPTAGRPDGELRESISFVNLAFNQGLGDGPFER